MIHRYSLHLHYDLERSELVYYFQYPIISLYYHHWQLVTTTERMMNLEIYSIELPVDLNARIYMRKYNSHGFQRFFAFYWYLHHYAMNVMKLDCPILCERKKKFRWIVSSRYSTRKRPMYHMENKHKLKSMSLAC